MTGESLDQLVLRYFDNDLSDSEFAVMQDTLANSAEARRRYHQLAELNGLLATVVRQPMPQPVAARPRRSVVSQRPLVPAERPKSWLMTGLAAAAAVVLAALALNVYWVRTRQPLVTFRAAPGSLVETTRSASEKPGANALGIGSRMRLRQGAVALDFSSGVKAIVSGPADFTMTSKNQLRLDEGRARFTVPPRAVGFTVAARGLEVLDLGTEFGVVAQQAGHGAEVHVFTGKVSATPSGGRGEIVRAGLARRAEVGGTSLREIPLAPSLFPTSLPGSRPSQAATIISGVTATASNTYPGGLVSPSFLVDNSGLSIPNDLSATHTILGTGPSPGNGVPPNSWHSDNGTVGNEFVTFDLHGTYNLKKIYIWQMNQNVDSTTPGRGVKQFDLLVSPDGINFTEVSSNLILSQATGAPVSAQSFALNQRGVTHVRIKIDSSWSDTTNDYVGLSEVKFTAVP